MNLEARLESIDLSLKSIASALAGGKPAAAPKGDTAKPAAEKPKAEDKPKGITYDDVKTPFLALVKSKGREAGVALLKKFNAEKLPDVKPTDFQAVLDAIKEAEKASEGALA